ncbi:MAG: hypothetical protein WAV41_00175 [Microgenomates group bacterium]
MKIFDGLNSKIQTLVTGVPTEVTTINVLVPHLYPKPPEANCEVLV